MRTQAFWLALAGLAGATVVAAQAPPPLPNPDAPRQLRQRVHQPPGVGQFMIYSPERLVNRREALNLTADQVARLEALAQEERQARARSDSTAGQHEDQLKSLWEAAQPDARAIETHMRAAGQARQDGAVAAARAAAGAKAVLTPEQQGRVAGWFEGARAMVRRGDGMRGPPRPGMGFRRR